MSKVGLKVAKQYGLRMKGFKSISEAEEFFFSFRDDLLGKFSVICNKNGLNFADYSVDSLKDLEKWYFELFEKDRFSTTGLSREEFEQCMGLYFGEVIIRNNKDAKYIVNEFPFVPGKYELYINKGLASIAIIGFCTEWYAKTGNKRRTLLYREYNKYFNS